ncbi:hypothetical protein I533_13200 [Alteromonas mediterranea MED64]|nr:hypothetical protein I533_13200 [Alteromonas mediterranea MED64]
MAETKGIFTETLKSAVPLDVNSESGYSVDRFFITDGKCEDTLKENGEVLTIQLLLRTNKLRFLISLPTYQIF